MLIQGLYGYMSTVAGCMTVNGASVLGAGRNLCNSQFPRQSASADSEYPWMFLDLCQTVFTLEERVTAMQSIVG